MASNEPRLQMARINMQPRKETPSNPDIPKLQRTQKYKDLGPLLHKQNEDSFQSMSAENPQENSSKQPRRIKRQDTPRPSSDLEEEMREIEPLNCNKEASRRIKRQATPIPPFISADETQVILDHPHPIAPQRRSSQAARSTTSPDTIDEVPPKPSRRKQIGNALLNLFRWN